MIRKKEPKRATIQLPRIHRLVPITLSLLLAALAPVRNAAEKSKAGLPPEILNFIKDKEAEARMLAKKLDLKISSDVWAYFRTAQTGTTAAITNAFDRLKKRSSQYEGS